MQKFSHVDEGQMRLFGSGGEGTGLERLMGLCDGLEVPRHAAETVSAYASDWRSFKAWCAGFGRDPIPGSEETIRLYIGELLTDRKNSISTARRRLAAINHFHRTAGAPPPDVSRARRLIRNARHDRGEHPKGKTGLHAVDLPGVSAKCDETVSGLRDRALVLLGFCTALRREDLARIQLCDVCFVPQGFTVWVKRSKTDQEARGRLIPVWTGERVLTDPVDALQRWIAVRGVWPGPLFCRIRAEGTLERKGISGKTVCDRVKKAVASAGLDPAEYGAHSLKRGSISTVAELGRSDQEIMGFSGHSSPAVMRMYVERSRVFAGRNPLAGAL